MKEIKMKCGLSAIVDNQDYDWLMEYTWRPSDKENLYPRTWIKKGYNYYRAVRMHRMIMNVVDEPQKLVDHINRNPLDNRRNNLRLCTEQENQFNRLRSDRKLPYKGVTSRFLANGTEIFVANIQRGKMRITNQFLNMHDAAEFYNKWAQELFGDFAIFNKVVR